MEDRDEIMANAPTEKELQTLQCFDELGIALDNLRGLVNILQDLALLRKDEDEGLIFTALADALRMQADAIESAKELIR